MQKEKNSKSTKNEKTKENEYKESLQRLQAEFENYKKRTSQELQEQTTRGKANLLSALLPIIDNFELAFLHAEKNDPAIKGFELIYASLHDALAKEGVEALNPQGELFNPHEHEAVLTQASAEPRNTILEVLQKGYKIHQNILRPAKVKVSSGGGTHHE